MVKDDGIWRQRLMDAIRKAVESGIVSSERQIGIQAGAGPSFVSDLKNMEKAPRVPYFLAVCAVIQVSPAYILTGIPITPEAESIISAFARLPEDRRKIVLDLARSLSGES